MLAVKYRKFDIAELLIEYGADINQIIFNTNYLISALKKGCLVIAKSLIDNGANINQVDEEDNTPLIYASKNGYTEIVELLIQNGANVNYSNKYGNTALMLATRNGHFDIVKFLIENRAQINHENDDRYTALIWAAHYGHFDIFKLLIKKGVQLNIHQDLRKKLYNSKEESGDFDIIVWAAKDEEGNFKEGTGIKLKVHKAILAIYSSLFRNMFLYTQPEYGKENQVYDYSDYNIEDIQNIIKFMYGIEINPEAHPEYWSEMLEYYQVQR